jgi:acetylornithine aminotransferase
MATYKRLPVTFERGEGVWLWDQSGKRYLDALSGIAVCGLGHAHPGVGQAICEQAGSLLHTSNLYGIANQQALADVLTEQSGLERVFFANSGAEANEAAIKIARLYGHRRGVETPSIIVMDNSFHGRTLATLTATGNRKAQAGFEPLVKGFIRAPFGDIEALRKVAETVTDVVAVLVEPIQGEGGVNIPDDDYLRDIRTLCDQQQWLMMLDEIQTGMGRTGKLFAYQHSDILPDVMTLAKGLGNGVPIGACLARGDAAEVFGPGNHGSTFGGNPLACAAGLAVMQSLRQDALAQRAQTLGDKLLRDFSARLGQSAGVREIRGRGLMIGIELDRACAELAPQALQAGLLINVTAERVVRLLPPLIMDDEQADLLVSSVCELIEKFLA